MNGQLKFDEFMNITEEKPSEHKQERVPMVDPCYYCLCMSCINNAESLTRFGNTRQKNVFKEFYKTNIGEFTPEKWLEATLQIIQTLMENELLEEIKEHIAGYCVWLKNDKEIEEYSASCLASGAYMYWEDFKDKRLPAHKVFIFEGGDF